jgi:hypothetical protein
MGNLYFKEGKYSLAKDLYFTIKDYPNVDECFGMMIKASPMDASIREDKA